MYENPAFAETLYQSINKLDFKKVDTLEPFVHVVDTSTHEPLPPISSQHNQPSSVVAQAIAISFIQQ